MAAKISPHNPRTGVSPKERGMSKNTVRWMRASKQAGSMEKAMGTIPSNAKGKKSALMEKTIKKVTF